MKTYIAEIIPRLIRFSKKLDDLTKLTNQHWVSLSEIEDSKKVYIFRDNNQLIISDNGIVEKGSWEFLGNNTILLETKKISLLLKHGFFDENIIALKIDSTDSYIFFVNENKYDFELNSIDDVLSFLEKKYLNENNIFGDDSNEKMLKLSIPEYKILSITEKRVLFQLRTKVFKIQFSDGKIGEIFLNVKNNEAYFKVKSENSFLTDYYYYINFDYSIIALNYFFNTGKISKEGFIISYS